MFTAAKVTKTNISGLSSKVLICTKSSDLQIESYLDLVIDLKR